MKKEIIEKNVMSASDVSVIIPLKVTDANTWTLSRIQHFSYSHWEAFGEIRIVDYGSNEFYSAEIKRHCEKYGLIYQVEDTSFLPFSLSTARNKGAQKTDKDYILFCDIDIIVNINFPFLLEMAAASTGMIDRHYRFISCPVIYLTEQYSKTILNLLEQDEYEIVNTKLYHTLHESGQRFKSGTVAFQAPSSSIQLFNRFHYLAMGGQDPNQSTHGGEDFDFVLRNLLEYKEFPIPSDILNFNTSWYTGHYRGARALISLPGKMCQSIGLCTYHLHHEQIQSWNSNTINKWKWIEIKTRNYLNSNYKYKALPNLSNDKKIVVFVNMNSANYEYIRELLPIIGNCIVEGIDCLDSVDTFESVMELHSTNSAIVMAVDAPKVRDRLLDLTAKSYEVSAFTRGALPDAWFFDQRIFGQDFHCVEPITQNNELSWEQEKEVEGYLQKINRDAFCQRSKLEPSGTEELLSILGLSPDEKVLLIVLDDESEDFIGTNASSISYSDFTHKINDICLAAQKVGWKCVIQTDLEHFVSSNQYVTVPFSVNVWDLIGISSGVVCYNNGIGLLALSQLKPVSSTCRSFYLDCDIGHHFDGDVNNLIEYMTSKEKEEKKKVYSLYYHLLSQIYSFASETVSNSVDHSEDRKVIRNRFYRINVKGIPTICREINLRKFHGGERLFTGILVESDHNQSNKFQRDVSKADNKDVKIVIGNLENSYLELETGITSVKKKVGELNYIWHLKEETNVKIISDITKPIDLELFVDRPIWKPFNFLRAKQSGTMLSARITGFFRPTKIVIRNIKPNVAFKINVRYWNLLSFLDKSRTHYRRLLSVNVLDKN